MGLLRRKQHGHPDSQSHTADQPDVPVGYNPYRDEYLYWLTDEGYLIAQDMTCQYDYVHESRCPHCGGPLTTVAHINRGGQGLSELLARCEDCGERVSFIFDISNDVYQRWWHGQLGSLYIRQYDGPPRTPYTPE